MAATRRTLERSEHLRWLITLRRMSAGLQLKNSDIACGARNTLHLLHRSVFIVDSLDGKNRCSDRAEVFPIGRKRDSLFTSLVDQLKREGIELRDRGDTTNAIERLQEALDSEPNNTAVLSELAKTYDLAQLYDRANEVWRKLQEMGPSAGAAYELADRRLKLGAPTPAAAPMPTAPDSSSREVSTSPYGTAADVAKYATNPREHEIDQVPPLPTSTASEVSSPATRANPAEPGPSAETAVAQPAGRLIVLRTANFGWNLALNLKIDGRTAANIVQGGRYDDFVPAGRHVLTVSAVPNYQPTSTVLNVQRGQTYVFTAVRQNTGVVLVPSK